MKREGNEADYVQAILELACRPWIEALRTISHRLQADPAALGLTDPTLTVQEKIARLTALVPNAPVPVRNLLERLVRENQTQLIGGIAALLEQRVARRADILVAQVTSAVPLTDQEKQTLAGQLAARMGKELVFDYRVDPEIVGGVIVRVGDQVIDGSVRRRLQVLQEQLA